MHATALSVRRSAILLGTTGSSAASSTIRIGATRVTSTRVQLARTPIAATPLPTRTIHTMSATQSAAIPSSGHPAFVNPYAGTSPLTPEEIAVIKQTVPVLAEHGLTLTTNFYTKMLGKVPELKNIFNHAHQATGMQPQALASAVYAYAANIDNLGVLGPAVSLMAHKHCSLSILPAMYEIVGSNLLETLRELLTAAKFPEPTIDAVIAAWARAYAQLANILIVEEERLYTEMAAREGGWRGWRKFIIARVEQESESGITSFYMKPKDGGLLPTYLPGQFTTINQSIVDDTGATFTQPRQYSLSEPSSGQHFRITVKREDEPAKAIRAGHCPFGHGAASRPAGRVSTAIHAQLKVGSEVDLAPPYGNFTLDTKVGTPVVLVGAGVGLTPLVAMAETARAAGRKVCFLYACDTGRAHPLKTWFQSTKTAEFSSKVWYRAPEPQRDEKGRDYDEIGLMDLTQVSSADLLQPGADYFVCGPPIFMTTQLAALRKLGVPADKLHAEAFGTGDVALSQSI